MTNIAKSSPKLKDQSNLTDSKAPPDKQSPALLPSRGPQAPGEVRLAREELDQLAWDTLVKKLRTQFALSGTGTVAGDLPLHLSQITCRLDLQLLQSQAQLPHFHAEALLDQCADLLDRGLSIREKYDQLAAKWFEQLLELHEFARLDEVHRKEEAAGLYEVPTHLSESELESQRAVRLASDEAHTYANYLIERQLDSATRADLTGEAEKQAWLSGVASYSIGEGDLNYYTATWNEVEKYVRDHAQDAAHKQTWEALDREETYALIQRSSLEGRLSEAKARISGLEKRAKWDRANEAFQRERTRIARDLQDIKLKAATVEDGLLNYSRRLEGLRSRFVSDFSNAVTRMHAASKGLLEVLGYSKTPPQDITAQSYFDDCLIWVREAIDWVVRGSRTDQALVLPISLRALVGDSAWRRGRSRGNWTFEISHDLLSEYSLVRMRGFTLTAEVCSLSDQSRLWQLEASPPTEAVVRDVEQSQGQHGRFRTLKQEHLPPCIAARVGKRASRREPDVHAITTWHNASPFGKWNLKLLGSVPHAPSSVILKDVLLELAVSARRPLLTSAKG